MYKEHKEEVINDIREIFSDVTSVVLADYRGIDVPTVTVMRDELRAADCGYRIFKNTLLKIAVADSDKKVMMDLFSGPTAVIWSKNSPSAAAKIVLKFAKEEQAFTIKGGFFDGQKLDELGIKELATIPSEEVLRSTLLMLFIAAPTDFVRQTMAAPQSFVYLLNARKNMLESK